MTDLTAEQIAETIIRGMKQIAKEYAPSRTAGSRRGSAEQPPSLPRKRQSIASRSRAIGRRRKK